MSYKNFGSLSPIRVLREDFGSLKLIFFERMFHFTRDKRIGVLFKDTQAGAGAEVDLLAAIVGARIIHWVFQFTSAGSFVFG